MYCNLKTNFNSLYPIYTVSVWVDATQIWLCLVACTLPPCNGLLVKSVKSVTIPHYMVDCFIVILNMADAVCKHSGSSFYCCFSRVITFNNRSTRHNSFCHCCHINRWQWSCPLSQLVVGMDLHRAFPGPPGTVTLSLCVSVSSPILQFKFLQWIAQFRSISRKVTILLLSRRQWSFVIKDEPFCSRCDRACRVHLTLWEPLTAVGRTWKWMISSYLRYAFPFLAIHPVFGSD